MKAGISKDIIEGDCSSVIYRCKFDGSAPPWDIENVIVDIRSFVSSLEVMFIVVRRSANSVADLIAKAANR